MIHQRDFHPPLEYRFRGTMPQTPRRLPFAKIFTTNIPNVDNPIWEVETAPLLAELSSRSMTIDEVVIWGAARGDNGTVIKHKLAWLSFTNRAAYDPGARRWTIDSASLTPRDTRSLTARS
jgi:hypothetical protein